MFPISKLNNKLKKQGYILQIKTLLYKHIVEYRYTNIELLPIYLNGETFILTHLNSTDSLSKLSKIIFSADILWQITSFNTEQSIFSVEKGLNFYVWAVKRFIFNDPLPKDFSSVWYAPKRICHWIRKRRKLSMMKNTYKRYEDGVLHSGWNHLLSYCTKSFTYIGIPLLFSKLVRKIW